MEDTFLWGLEINDSLTQELTSKVSVIAVGVGLICFVCNMAYNYLSHGVSQLLNPNEDRFPDYSEIARCLALFFCLSLYSPLAKTVVGTLEVINKNTTMTTNRANEFSELMAQFTTDQGEKLLNSEEEALKDGVKSGDENAAAMDKELDNISQGNQIEESSSILRYIGELINPGNWGIAILHSLAAALVGIIQIIILGIGVVSLKVLIILGPFVFAFSILPVFQKQLSVWFGTVCSIGMVFTVINVLNEIMWFSLKGIFTPASDALDQMTKVPQMLGLDLAMIGVYCSCFWLSSKIVGHADAGRIISKTMSVLTSAATLMVAGAAGAAAAGGKLTNVAAAANAGKSLIDEQ